MGAFRYNLASEHITQQSILHNWHGFVLYNISPNLARFDIVFSLNVPVCDITIR